MSAQLIVRTEDGEIILDERVREEAQETVHRAHDRQLIKFKAVLDDGSELEIPEPLTRVLEFALHGLTQGDLSVTSIPDELTTTTAAKLLGVSRPTLMKLLDSGQLPSWKVGSHHRLSLQEVMALRTKRRTAQRAAQDELRDLEDELGIDT